MELNMENNTLNQIRYEEAAKKVKKLKGFYTHAIVYLVINSMIIILNIQNLNEGESYFQLKKFLHGILLGIRFIGSCDCNICTLFYFRKRLGRAQN
jgi:hypothetical protein